MCCLQRWSIGVGQLAKSDQCVIYMSIYPEVNEVFVDYEIIIILIACLLP